MLHASDQAAGLRRLFRRAPSAVVALFASGRAPRQLAVQTLVALTEGARRVVAIDEHAPEHGSLLAAFGYPEGGDLLGALQGRIEVTETMREVADGLWVVPAAATALQTGWNTARDAQLSAVADLLAAQVAVIQAQLELSRKRATMAARLATRDADATAAVDAVLNPPAPPGP